MKFMAEVKIFMNDMNTFMGKQINNRGESNREELKQLLDIDEFLQFEENLVEPVFRTKIVYFNLFLCLKIRVLNNLNVKAI